MPDSAIDAGAAELVLEPRHMKDEEFLIDITDFFRDPANLEVAG